MKLNAKLALTILAVVVLLLSGFFIYRSVTPVTVDQNTRIVVVFKSLNEGMGFWEVVRDGIEVAAREFGVKVEIVGAKFERDITRQIEILEEVIAEKPDAIVLAASDYNKLVPAAQRIKRSGIKLVTIDSGINSDLPESFIATDNIEAGRKAGKEMARILDGEAEVAIISHVKATATAIEREKGVREGLVGNSIKKVYDTFFSDNDQEKAYGIAKELVTTRPGIKGIVCLNETSTLGAAKAIKELGLSEQVKLVGFDSAIEEVKLLEEGIIKATVVQNPFNMGYRGIEMAVKAIKGEKMNKRIDTGSVVVTKENMYTSENQKLLFPFVDQ